MPGGSLLRRLARLRVMRALRFAGSPAHVPAPLMRFPSFEPAVQAMAAEHLDYFRFATLGLALRRIELDGVEGDLAEVGVYQGSMSRFIRRACPERTLHLFDTFEGFPATDLEPGSAGDSRFRDTSVDQVLEHIGDVRRVAVRKGKVPESFVGLENQRFAFVLLDLDLYAPTAASLEFFYPRLTRGAYLVVHDYNSPESHEACRRALDAFMRGRPERPVELADEWGSVVVRKS